MTSAPAIASAGGWISLHTELAELNLDLLVGTDPAILVDLFRKTL
jgi:uncharacterized membrane protein YbjE (DUF340 family)